MLYVNGTPIDVTMFPDNTSQVWNLPAGLISRPSATIDWEFSHEGEFMHLAQLKHLLDMEDVKVYLRLKYLPYGRQDKRISNETTFALLSFGRLINSLRFEKVFCLDPHSDVAELVIERFFPHYPIATIVAIRHIEKIDALCFPDSGANKKYGSMFPGSNLYGEKVRNQKTGWIESYKLVGDPKGKRILIVDDICDGGMTFKLLTRDLLKAGATEVQLFVTHGLFTKGLRTLRQEGITKIFTADGEASEVQNNIVYRKL